VFEKVELLGKRTAEMHLALLKGEGEAAFAAEKFNPEYVQLINKNLNALLKKRLNLLKDNYARLDKNARKLADDFINNEAVIENFFAKVLNDSLGSSRIRIH